MPFPRLSKFVQQLKFSAHQPDGYISRLRCSVIGEGMLHPGNVLLLEYALQNMPENGAVVEVGAYGGLSTNLITYLLDKHQRSAPLLGCDAWVYEGFRDQDEGPIDTIDGRSDIRRDDYTAYIKDAFVRASRLLSAHRLPHTCHLSSDAFFEIWNDNGTTSDVFGRQVQLGGPIAFAYIDGDHAYETARRDIENVARHLLPGGYILLDDSAAHLPFGSARLAKEMLANPRFQVVKKNPNYLFRKK